MGVALYFDPPSHHFLGDRLFDRGFAGHCGDEILAPYAYLKEFLNARGVAVHTADNLPSAPENVKKFYVSAGVLCNYRRLARRQDVVLSALFVMECPTVDPGLYRELNHAQHSFKRVYSWSDSGSLEPYVGGPLHCLPMRWPQSFDSVHEEIWRRTDRCFLVMLNGNKLPRHRTACRELYSERLNAVDYFSRTGDIDLYGNGWEGPPMLVGPAHLPFCKVPVPGTVQRIQRHIANLRHRLRPDSRLKAARKVYRGFAKSKAEVLGRYKFALCFENSILKGWLTEKIFDCFFAGTVPVYWGAPDIAESVPSGCFIDMRRFQTHAELRSFLKSVSDLELREYKENARAFLASPRYRPFTKQTFAEMFGRIIEEDSGVKLREIGAAVV
jgi:hypothetical protein